MADENDQQPSEEAPEQPSETQPNEVLAQGAKMAMFIFLAAPFVILFTIAWLAFFLRSGVVLSIVVLGVVGTVVGTAWTVKVVTAIMEAANDKHHEEIMQAHTAEKVVDLGGERRRASASR